MKKQTFFYCLAIFTLLASACAPAVPTAAAPIAVAPHLEEAEKQAYNPPAVYPTAAVPPAAPLLPAAQPTQPVAEEWTRPLPTPAYNSGIIGSAPLGQVYPTAIPQDTTFENPGTNPMTRTEYDNLSTFALDVDTAAYTIGRKYIQEGSLPPPDSVRVEEYVNFFDPGYTAPSNIAFALYADGAPSPFPYRQGAYILRFGVKGYEIPESQRSPLSLTFVIDVSGSMNMDNRLGLVKRSLELLVNRLRDDDTVSIVVYGSNARIQLPVTRGSQRDQILNAIYSLSTEGSTNAGEGLRLGYQMAMQSYRSNSSNRVILCSDGVANTGITAPEEILSTVEGYVSEGITLTTLGFGMQNYNDSLLEKLADKGNGNYNYIDTIDQARDLFVNKMTSTLNVIAKDAKIQVDFNPEVVAAYRQVGYENRQVADQDFRNDQVDAGELGPGHTVTALYEIVLRPNAQGRLATLQMRWADPKTSQVTEINGNFNTWDMKDSFYNTEPRYQLAVAVSQFAEILRDSPYAEGQSLSTVEEIAYPLRNTLSNDPDVVEFIRLVEQANRMSRGGW